MCCPLLVEQKKRNTMKNQTAPLAEQRTDTFDSVDFIFILFHKVGSIIRGKTTVLRTEKNRRKRHGVVFYSPLEGALSSQVRFHY